MPTEAWREATQCRDATVLYGYSILVLIHLGRGDFDEAFAALAQAERLMQSWQVADEVYLAWLSNGESQCLDQSETVVKGRVEPISG